MNRCLSVRSKNQRSYQCSLYAIDNKYCTLHNPINNNSGIPYTNKNIIDFDLIRLNDELEQQQYSTKSFGEIPSEALPVRLNLPNEALPVRLDLPMCSGENMPPYPKLINPIIKKLFYTDNTKKRLVDDIHLKDLSTNKSANTSTNTYTDQISMSTIETSHNDNQDELNIKLLILINDIVSYDKISNLVGPVFKDVTISDDECDPITYDKIWNNVNNIRYAGDIYKYYLFSYVDTNGKIRCFTIFTIYDLLAQCLQPICHPITTIEIQQDDLDRARKLIDFYTEKVDLFSVNNLVKSPEFNLKNRLKSLFRKFNLCNFFFEESWLLDLTNREDIATLISTYKSIIINNIRSINPSLTSIDLFQKYTSNIDSNINTIDLHIYIIEQWEKLTEYATNSRNNIAPCIIAYGLAEFMPAVKEKYPLLLSML